MTGQPKLNINEATVEQLFERTGLDRGLLETILRHRPFDKIADVARVPGVTNGAVIKLANGGVIGGNEPA